MASEQFILLELELEDLKDEFEYLLDEYKQDGNIDIFTDLTNNLLLLNDKVKSLPNYDERDEIVNEVADMVHIINNLLF